MGDGSGLPSVFTYAQTIEWIANAIGSFMSHAHIVREMRHLSDNDFGVEPPLNIVITRLGWAEWDDPEHYRPKMSPGEAVQQAEDDLYDALCAGRVTMTGHPNWEPAYFIRAISKLECTNLRFREDTQGVVTAAIRTNLSAFWSAIRFDSGEIGKEWSNYLLHTVGEEGMTAFDKSKQKKAVSGKRSPSLTPDIGNALKLIYPDGKPKAVRRQEMIDKIKERTGLQVSASTLDRARKTVWPG